MSRARKLALLGVTLGGVALYYWICLRENAAALAHNADRAVRLDAVLNDHTFLLLGRAGLVFPFMAVAAMAVFPRGRRLVGGGTVALIQIGLLAVAGSVSAFQLVTAWAMR